MISGQKCLPESELVAGKFGNPTLVTMYNVGGVQPHFSPWGKMGKKYMERKGKVLISLSFHILFSPFFPMGKNGKTHIFPWAKMGLDPPPPPNVHYARMKLIQVFSTDTST